MPLEHLARLKSDPWAAYWKKPQALDPAMEKLGFVPQKGRSLAAT